MSKNFPMLYVKTASGAINFWEIRTEGRWVHTKWGKVGTDNPQTERYAAEGKNVGRSNETTPSDQAEFEAQAKYDKQVRLKYVDSVEAARGHINIKPMRAYSLDDKRLKKLKFPVAMQPKFNGVRCMAYNLPDGKVRLMSRGGKDYSLPHVQTVLEGRIPPSCCLDGELYVHGMSLQSIRHLIETPCADSAKVCFHVYDMTTLPPTDAEWSDRYRCLLMFFQDNWLAGVVMSPTMVALNKAGIDQLHDKWVAEGYEGAMIRTMEGKYKLAAKSTDLLKVKKFQDAEFVVKGWLLGKDGVIQYVCVQEDGKEFEVRPKGDEAERKRLYDERDTCIGRKLTVKFQERSDDNIPIFPVGVAFRGEEDLD